MRRAPVGIIRAVVGAWVAVCGELTMSRPSGPVEDELCAVRVSIEADDVRVGGAERLS